jgi:hypothetical protein
MGEADAMSNGGYRLRQIDELCSKNRAKLSLGFNDY